MPSTTSAPATSQEQVDRLLAAARETIAKVPYCWVATRAEDGGANARAVRAFAGMPEGDEWTRRFLTRRGSRKAAEIRRAPRVTLAYQHESGDAYVALAGVAELVDDRTEMRSLWQAAWDALFPAGFADAHMIVVRVAVDRIEMHARGVTAEPFGHGRTLLERAGAAGWRLVPD
jgi:general stress protein 26